MSNKKEEKLKNAIEAVVGRSGVAIRTQHIRNRVALPAGADLDGLLMQLMQEGRLTRRPTLLNNGETDYVYNLP
jgi:hypothetical protein